MRNLLKKGVVLPLIVVFAISLVVYKVKSKPPIEHEELQFPVKTVDVVEVKKIPFRAKATAYGSVEPAVEIVVKAEVPGKISYLHPDLKKGGSLPKGTVVLKIEPTTFEFGLNQSKAALVASESALKQLAVEEESTRKSLKIAQQNLQVGMKELKRLQGILKKGLIARSNVDAEKQKVLQLRQSVEDLQGKLTAYKSRRSSTTAQINQSKSLLNQSEDTLLRTEIRLPFDARIGQVFVEKGEFVGQAGVLFEASGTDAVEINAQMSTGQFQSLLAGFSDKTVNLQKPDALQLAISQLQLEANVSLVRYEGESPHWQAQLQRIGESIDPKRDTIDLVVTVQNPYARVIPGKRPPLLKGMYVRVEFLAPAIERFVIPRKAIHQGRVYVASSKNQLEIRPVHILQRQNDVVVIDSGLMKGEKVIITDVIPIINGLPIKAIRVKAVEEHLFRTSSGL